MSTNTLSLRQRLLAWATALCVAFIALSELLMLDYALAWVAGGYLDSASVESGVLIFGAIASLLISWRLLVAALRAERAIAINPDAIEIAP